MPSLLLPTGGQQQCPSSCGEKQRLAEIVAQVDTPADALLREDSKKEFSCFISRSSKSGQEMSTMGLKDLEDAKRTQPEFSAPNSFVRSQYSNNYKIQQPISNIYFGIGNGEKYQWILGLNMTLVMLLPSVFSLFYS